MTKLKLNEFLDKADDCIRKAAQGENVYSVQTGEGTAVILSEDEYNILSEVMRIVLGDMPGFGE